MMVKKNEMDMTSGNLFKKLFIFSMPLVLSGILQLLYNAADLIVCGQFGSEHSVAAISSTNSLINLIIQLFLGLSVGANVLMARCFGEGNKEKGQRVVYTSMIFSVIFGLIIGIFGVFSSRYFLELMGTPDDVIDLSAKYLMIYFIGLPFSMIYNFGASLLRAIGDTKRPFYFLMTAGIFNVLLNLLFVIVFKLDVPGVAIATIISQGISAGLVVLCLLRNKGFFRFRFRELRIYKREALEIIRIGLPAGLQGVIFSLSNVLIQSSINSLGTNVMDGNGAASSLEGFIYTAMNAVAQSCVAFVSANFGAGKKKNIQKSVMYSAILVILMNFVVGGIVLLLENQLLGLYVHTEEALEAGRQRLFIIAVTYFLCGLMDTFAYALRGIGYSLLPTIISLCGACGLRILWIYFVFPLEEFHNISGLAVSYPISWIITAMVHFIFFLILFSRIKLTPRAENNADTAGE